jgi:hypothetical protein
VHSYPRLVERGSPKPAIPKARSAFIIAGHSRAISIEEELASDFKRAFQEAYDVYRTDLDPKDRNTAPKECWPSARVFRYILFEAGRHRGLEASRYLDRVPDRDLQLFAQIELCAAIHALPQFAGLTLQTSAKRPVRRAIPVAELERRFGPVLPGIRCPKCAWTPRAKHRWQCRCRHRWNTFETRGVCPECGHQWETTGCLSCRAISPHTDWYVPQ